MAKIRMVTRTIEVNRFEVMTCNIETAEVAVITVETGAIPTNGNPEKIVRAIVETPTVKFCAIVNHEKCETLYGMPEDDFIKYACPVER